LFRDSVYKPSLVILNKIDLVDQDDVDELKAAITAPTIAVSLVHCEIDREGLCESLIKVLDMVRIYTKEPWSSSYSQKPYLMKRGSTVGDLAMRIHSRLYEGFRYARVWRLGEFPGNYKRVGLNYILEDRDIVEIHSAI
jgi:ribosome-interacting GTPase 1